MKQQENVERTRGEGPDVARLIEAGDEMYMLLGRVWPADDGIRKAWKLEADKFSDAKAAVAPTAQGGWDGPRRDGIPCDEDGTCLNCHNPPHVGPCRQTTPAQTFEERLKGLRPDISRIIFEGRPFAGIETVDKIIALLLASASEAK